MTFHPENDAAFVAAIEEALKGVNSVSPSPCPDICETCSRTDWPMEYECPVDEGGFSWSSCDSCGSGLGGDRYAAHGFLENGELTHLEICPDCMMYHANGETPGESARAWEG